MQKTFLIVTLLLFFTSCEERTEKMENSRGIPGPEKVEALAPGIDEQERDLQNRGFQTRRQQLEDTTYLMLEYYVAFLKSSANIETDSTEIVNIRQKHQAYLENLSQEGHASLAGSVPEEYEIAEMIIFNTPSLEEADSLIQISPLVEAGILSAEVQPLWVRKGAQLQ